jgi:hypothetical protein
VCMRSVSLCVLTRAPPLPKMHLICVDAQLHCQLAARQDT